MDDGMARTRSISTARVAMSEAMRSARGTRLSNAEISVNRARLFRVRGDYDVRFQFKRFAWEEIAPRFELLYEHPPIFHRLKVLDGATWIIPECLRHGLNPAASSRPNTADIEGVAIVILDQQVEAASTLSPIESQCFTAISRLT